MATIKRLETGQQGGRKGLAGLARQQARQMVNTDHAKRAALNLDLRRWAVKRGPIGIYGDGIVRIVGIAADIAHDSQHSIRRADLFQALFRDKGRDWRGAEVDAIDKDIGLCDFAEWPALGCLGQVPFQDVAFG